MVEIFGLDEIFPDECARHDHRKKLDSQFRFNKRKGENVMPTTIEPTMQSQKCPVCGRFFPTLERLALRNDSPTKEKRKIYHLLPMCDKCSEKHPDGHDSQKLFRYNQDVGA